MNRLDLRFEYHKETGKYPIEGDETSLRNDLPDEEECYDEDGDAIILEFGLKEYINWLEEKIINLKN